MLSTMRRGMRLKEGDQLAPVEVRVLEESIRGALLEMILIQGVNRQIRRMCRDMDLGIRFLRRVAQGPVRLDNLPKGQWRTLTAREIAAPEKGRRDLVSYLAKRSSL